MPVLFVLVLASAISVAGAVGGADSRQGTEPATAPPNFLILFIDDMGYGGTGRLPARTTARVADAVPRRSCCRSGITGH